MIQQKKRPSLQLNKSNSTATYKDKTVTVITIFSDIGIAMIEDEDGNILDVKSSELREVNS